MVNIDYIIPTYSKSSIVKRGLDVLCKQTMKDCLCVTLVNDCSPNTDCDYQDLIDEYKNKLNIRVIKTSKNVGAGLARQYGIDNTSNPYIMFQDDDDMLSSDYAIEDFVKAVSNADDTVRSVVSGWIEVDSAGNILNEKSGADMNTCIVRLIYRSIIEEYNISFDPDISRIFEDYDFATKYLYVIRNNSFKEIYLDNNYYVYVRDNAESVMNTANIQKVDLYYALVEFKKYKFLKEHLVNDDELWETLNSAFEKSFFALCRIAKNPCVCKDELMRLISLIDEFYSDLGDEYEVQSNSIIYNLSNSDVIVNIDTYYDYFMSNPHNLTDEILKVLT